jgi:hypothetical protein
VEERIEALAQALDVALVGLGQVVIERAGAAPAQLAGRVCVVLLDVLELGERQALGVDGIALRLVVVVAGGPGGGCGGIGCVGIVVRGSPPCEVLPRATTGPEADAGRSAWEWTVERSGL